MQGLTRLSCLSPSPSPPSTSSGSSSSSVSSSATCCSSPSAGFLTLRRGRIPFSSPLIFTFSLQSHVPGAIRVASPRPANGNLEPNSFSSSWRADGRGIVGGVVVRSASSRGPVIESEEVFFDGGVHYGDLLCNLVFGLTLVWLPLTMASVFRSLFLRYRFTNLRVTIQSGLLGGDRKDFSYEVVKDVKLVPRFIGEWGDLAIELNDGTKVDLRSVPKFREIAKYVEERAGKKVGDLSALSPTTVGARKKGFS